MAISGLSATQLENYRVAARNLVAKYDRNGDGQISQTEARGILSLGQDSYSFTTRLSRDFVNVTTVYNDNFANLDVGRIQRADRSQNGQVAADELVDYYLEQRDGNRDGKLGFWEKLGTSVDGMRDFFENRKSVESHRTHHLEFSPEVPVLDGPTPPPPSYRPTPPSVGPTPPRPSGRPLPPSVEPSRPTPPPVSGRPLPPGVSDRPLPPGV